MKTKSFSVAALVFIVLHFTPGVWTDDGDSFFDVDEQHDIQVPFAPYTNYASNSKARIRQELIGKLISAVKEKKKSAAENSNLISGPELLEIRDLLFDDKYKPWGAASLPNNNNHNSQVILDKIDDELFMANSERHSYDERSHQDARIPTRIIL